MAARVPVQFLLADDPDGWSYAYRAGPGTGVSHVGGAALNKLPEDLVIPPLSEVWARATKDDRADEPFDGQWYDFGPQVRIGYE